MVTIKQFPEVLEPGIATNTSAAPSKPVNPQQSYIGLTAANPGGSFGNRRPAINNERPDTLGLQELGRALNNEGMGTYRLGENELVVGGAGRQPDISHVLPGGIYRQPHHGSAVTNYADTSEKNDCTNNSLPPHTNMTAAEMAFVNFTPSIPSHGIPAPSTGSQGSTPLPTVSTITSPLPLNNPYHSAPLARTMTGQTNTSDFIPGADLSSFDASSTRAPAGYRGTPATQLGGWAEEEGEGVTKTWVEEQERRKRIELELHRKAEIARRMEEERRLGEEFWKGEEERFGPVVPEKIRPHSTGASVPIPNANPPSMRLQYPYPSSAPVPEHHYFSPPIPQAQGPYSFEQQPVIAPQTQQGPLPLVVQEQSLIVLDPPANQPGPPAPEPAPALTSPPSQQQTDRSSEAYQIKHIYWLDPSTNTIRRSPILLQNENGPCPLLALVNALVLSTPASTTTSLLDVLRTREHVSLGLLLDAVFDGVVSRTSSQGPEIDLGDLFAFLMSLSTGMNVNPLFVSQAPLGEHSSREPPPPPRLGTFENTKEMKLYNSFSIPLYHGWLPPPPSRVYGVLQRIAPSYEDVQNVLLQEEIVLHRVTTAQDGDPAGQVSEAEQKMIEDAAVIRDWLDSSRTQLTDWGLGNLTTYWDNPNGSNSNGVAKIGILFRNDHFLTVMKARVPGKENPVLLTLVTDMGYGGYEEVVWETLVSVRGEGGQFLTGDLRPVGGDDDGIRHNRSQPIRSLLNVGNDDEGWETVGSNRRRRGEPAPQQQNNPPRNNVFSPQNNEPPRRSFVDALLGRPDPSQRQQQQQHHRPKPTSSNALPNSEVPPPMLPPRTSSRTDINNSHEPPLIDLSTYRINITPAPEGDADTDYDLALAMQLQEEEDERERQRVQRQRQEQQQRQQNPSPPPPTPPRPLVPPAQSTPPRPTSSGSSVPDVPPPPYERHASGGPQIFPPVHPPINSYPPMAANPGRRSVPEFATHQHSPYQATVQRFPAQGLGGGGGDSLGRRRSEMLRRAQEARGLMNEFANGGGHPGGGMHHGRRSSIGQLPGHAGSLKEGKKDCVIM